MEQILDYLGGYAPFVLNTLKALAFLVIGFFVAGAVSRFIRRQVLKSEVLDNTLGSFFASIARYLILILVLIAVLNTFGFQVTSLIAVLGAASLAIGLALQGTLTDIAAGVMLVVFRPYKLDQYVDIGGTSGTVQDINIFTTHLVTPDNIQIILPNSKCWGSIITNYSAHDTRRLDLTFNIDYSDDAEKAMALIREAVDADNRIKQDPEPWIRLVNLGASSVDLGVRVWCDAGDYWELKWHLLKAAKQAFDDNGITIPYPHSVIVNRT